MQPGEAAEVLHALPQGVQAVLQLRRKLPERSRTEMPLRDSAAVSESSTPEMQDSQSGAL